MMPATLRDRCRRVMQEYRDIEYLRRGPDPSDWQKVRRRLVRPLRIKRLVKFLLKSRPLCAFRSNSPKPKVKLCIRLTRYRMVLATHESFLVRYLPFTEA